MSGNQKWPSNGWRGVNGNRRLQHIGGWQPSMAWLAIGGRSGLWRLWHLAKATILWLQWRNGVAAA